jgi:hypothetical protein
MENETNQPTVKILNSIKNFEAGPAKLITWSLSIIGGSILRIIDDSYLRPFEISYRYVYFLFLIGWILIDVSLYYALSVSRSSMVTELFNKENTLILIL